MPEYNRIKTKPMSSSQLQLLSAEAILQFLSMCACNQPINFFSGNNIREYLTEEKILSHTPFVVHQETIGFGETSNNSQWSRQCVWAKTLFVTFFYSVSHEK